MFLVQGLWLTSRQTLTDRDYQYARCGREMWSGHRRWPATLPVAAIFTMGFGLPFGGVAADRQSAGRTGGWTTSRKPEDQLVQASGELSTWDCAIQITHILLLLRLPFLAAGCLLGG